MCRITFIAGSKSKEITATRHYLSGAGDAHTQRADCGFRRYAKDDMQFGAEPKHASFYLILDALMRSGNDNIKARHI